MDILFIYPAESEGLLRNPKVCRWHPCNQNKRPACSSKLGQTGLMFRLRKVRDSRAPTLPDGNPTSKTLMPAGGVRDIAESTINRVIYRN